MITNIIIYKFIIFFIILAILNNKLFVNLKYYFPDKLKIIIIYK